MPAKKPVPAFADPSLTAVPMPEDLPPMVAQPDDNPNAGDPEGPTPAEGEPDPGLGQDEVEEDADADADNQDEDADADADDDAEKQAEAPSELPAGQAPAGQPGPAARAGNPSAAEPAAQKVDNPGAAYSPQAIRYEARIQILDAYQYPGGLTGAPDWVDRNWVGYADPDELRQIPAGPCLRVPLPVGLIAICRIGDYVCRQSVLLAPGLPADVRLEVWQREQFEKMFVPRQPLEFRPFNPPPLPPTLPDQGEPAGEAKPAKKTVKPARSVPRSGKKAA